MPKTPSRTIRQRALPASQDERVLPVARALQALVHGQPSPDAPADLNL